jgi:hypothetical protein
MVQCPAWPGQAVTPLPARGRDIGANDQVAQPAGGARRQRTVSALARKRLPSPISSADMLAPGRQMEMDDLVARAPGFWPAPANRIRPGLTPAHRRYHNADPLLRCHDPLWCQLQLDITLCHKPS